MAGELILGDVPGSARDIKSLAVVRVLSLLALGLVSLTAHAVTVDARSSVYLAGQSSNPVNTGLGILPQEIAVSGNSQYQFTNVSGTVDFDGGGSIASNGADGVAAPQASSSPDVPGLSAPTVSNGGSFPQIRYLAGVFTDGTLPAAPTPAKLLQSIGAAGFSPALGQIFFIGDGLTGTGSGIAQLFLAPSGAAKLFLGFIDHCAYIGTAPGCYQDSTGNINVTVSAVPLPAAAWLFISALGGLILVGRRRRLHGVAT